MDGPGWNPGDEFKYSSVYTFDESKFQKPEFDWGPDEEDIQIFHYRLMQEGPQILPHGGVTIAYDLNTGNAGVALCSIKDQFNRRIGRMIAEGRLKNGEAIHIGSLEHISALPIERAIELVLSSMCNDERYKAWEEGICKAVNATGSRIFLAWYSRRSKQWHWIKAFGPKRKRWQSWNKTVANGR